jgi:hypothetical protein
MAVPANILQTVQTYQMSGLAFLQNLCCFIATANTKFKDFDRLNANLGSTVTFDLPPRFTTTNSLVANFQPADQRVQPLTVDQQISTSYAFTDQQFIFNVREYMEKFGKSAVAEIGTKIEANVAGNCETAPYRFYGNGVTPINSYGQLSAALALFRNYGAAVNNVKGYLSDIAVPSIVNSGLNQFALDRNNKTANSWEVGAFSNCDWFQSNLLPVHTAGTIGNMTNGQTGTLTVTAVTLDANGAVISITATASGAVGADANAIFLNDRLQFNDGVAGQTNLRYRTFIGHEVSSNPVQVRATAAAATNGGSSVTIPIYPPLQAGNTNGQNINVAVQAGMTLSVLPSHRVGMITGGDPLFLAMPSLPNETPYPTGNSFDPETGVSLRQYYGSLFGQNVRGMVHDAIWGSIAVPEYTMALIFPL